MPKKSEDYNGYMRDYVLKRYHRRRLKWIEYLGGKCVACGSHEDLQFDHKDPATKRFTLAKILSGRNEKLVEEEIRKCQLLCIPCHKKKSTVDSRSRVKHGTFWMRKKYKCNCEPCVTAYKAYNKKYSDLNRQRRANENQRNH